MHLPPISSFITLEPLAMVHEKSPIPLPKAKVTNHGHGHDKLAHSQLLDTTIIQKMIQDTLPSSHLVVTKTELFPNNLHRTYLLHLSNSTQVILKLPPPPTTLLLRHERHFLETETTLLSLLSQTSPSLSLPHLLHSSSSCKPPSPIPFLLRTPTPCPRTLTSCLSALTSPNGQFGPCYLTASSRGFHTWRDAFAAMVEGVLMDAEDAGVLLPYGEVREAVRLGRGALGTVKVGRIVLVGGGGGGGGGRKGEGGLGMGMGLGGAVWGDGELNPEVKVGGMKGLLYSTYHALLTIVTNHYRPPSPSPPHHNKNITINDAELDARKQLTRNLAELANAVRKPN